MHRKKGFLQIGIAFALQILLLSISTPTVGAQTLDASFEFEPASKMFLRQCPSRIDIMIDPGTNESNAANIYIEYDPTKVVIQDSNATQSGIQIETGNAFSNYTDNVVNESTGEIRLTGYTLSKIATRLRFATIHFTSTESADSADFTIGFNGIHDTHDSNIAEHNTSDDILASVTNGSYTFEDGPCEADTQPPQITPVDPKNFDINVAEDGTVRVEVSDSGSGVDISTVVITINGISYNYTDPEHFSYEGTPGNYSITITPKEPFKANSANFVQFIAADMAGNWASADILFNIPPEACAPYGTHVECAENLLQCQSDLTNCQEENSKLEDLPTTGAISSSRYLGVPCWFYLLPLIIIILHPYWRNPQESDLLYAITPKTHLLKGIVFVIGLILAIIGIIDCFQIINILTIILYAIAILYILARKFLSEDEPESAYE